MIKCTIFYFRRRWGSLQFSIAIFKGPTYKGEEEKGELVGREWKRKGGREME